MKHLLYLLLAILGTAAFTACSDNKNNEGVITMVVESYYNGNYDSLTIYTFNEGDEISIDYGNGYAPIVISTKLEEDHNGISIRDGIKYGYILKYTFPNKGEHTITIKGNISGLDCSTNPSTSLDISKCTALAYLSCWNNQLTSLDISKNTALTRLNCSENPFTAEEMNKIYETLPNVGYDENGKPQGILNCDPLGNWSIAEKKGWEVSFYNEFNRLFTSFHL